MSPKIVGNLISVDLKTQTLPDSSHAMQLVELLDAGIHRGVNVPLEGTDSPDQKMAQAPLHEWTQKVVPKKIRINLILFHSF